jgi:hypothetical protein
LISDSEEVIQAVVEERNYYQQLHKKTEDRLQHYMSINSGLWMNLAKLPGGVEMARELQKWGQAHEDEVIYFGTV